MKIKQNIILIGYMGSGKTSVGKVLAKRLSYRFYDTDELLEQKAEDTISQIFSVHGEEYFRNLETKLLEELSLDMNETVLSTGGGLPLRKQNAELLKEMGYIVFLKATKQTTMNRLQGDITRPLLQGDDLEKKVEQMLALRTPIYEKIAHRIVKTDGESVNDIVNIIMEAYRKQMH